MSKRRRGYPERDARQAGTQGRPRGQRTSREARPQRPLPVRQRAAVPEVLPEDGLLSTALIVTTTSDSRYRGSLDHAMYVPAAFAEADRAKLHDFVRRSSFAVLTSNG